MKLETLNYIHLLLTENEKTTREAKRVAYEARDNAENSPNHKDLCAIAERTRDAWWRATDALDDFKAESW